MKNPGIISSRNNTLYGSPDGSVMVRPYNLKELSALYGVSARTLTKWLAPFEEQLGKRIGYFYTIPQVKKIFSNLGLPYTINDEGAAGL